MIAIIHIIKPNPTLLLYPFSLLTKDSIPLKVNTTPTSSIIRKDIKGKSVFQLIKLKVAKTVAINAKITSKNTNGFFRFFQIEELLFCFPLLFKSLDTLL